MRIIKATISLCKKYLWQKPVIAPKKSPAMLSIETLEQVFKEAEFLQKQHSVSVHALEPDEIPSIPTRAD